MNINSIVNSWLQHKGMIRKSGSGADPILPFLMLDAMYSILQKDLRPLDNKREMKLALKRWVASYTSFNRDFFASFSPEQRDEVIDIMDDFQAFIGNDILVAKVAVMNELKQYGLTFEQQKVVAACMVCHVLTQTADIAWEAVYKNRWGEDKRNPYIKGILKHSWDWMNIYFGKITNAYVNPNDSEPICKAMSVLCNRMVKFLDKLEAA